MSTETIPKTPMSSFKADSHHNSNVNSLMDQIFHEFCNNRSQPVDKEAALGSSSM